MNYKIANCTISGQPALVQTAKDLLADALGEVGFESFEETQQGLKAYIPAESFDEQCLKEVLKNIPIQEIDLTYHLEDMEDKNWNEVWENAGFAPIAIDEQLIIYDAKSAFVPATDNKIYIGIEARQAFGTGNHQTTRMMISMLLKLRLSEERVLDCGCGTGILSIAASKLGASKVIGYDIDEWSVNNTLHNATMNNVTNLEVFHGNAQVLSHVSGLFDVVLANINRNILLQDMTSFVELMSPEAILLLSGFYEADANLLIEKATQLGLVERNRKTEDDWCCLMFTKEK
ncbi:ribosomal protein L11 methyltransferase [Hoylesella timonensis]|uniref:Ribosomal protein L11 methyltransferase n=1 Tax=Hoylesella timonensis TaxID=386414 RepID=A0A2K0XJ87_9BACT|nr:50S ribosomal protein L11 methyltransferase [Hoylesella timonensis]PNP94602.1 ribosomal protein L11 methyltransferase [Hoylesella timonensis]